mgnify:CR=1 FL=1
MGLLPPRGPGDSGDASVEGTGCAPYLQYLRHIRSRLELSAVLDTEEAVMETSYLDHLQSPLQPLGDNLEFQTYETFEKDPVKYARYEDAVRLYSGHVGMAHPSTATVLHNLVCERLYFQRLHYQPVLTVQPLKIQSLAQ